MSFVLLEININNTKIHCSCRGVLGSTILVFCVTGIFLGYILGTYVSYAIFPYMALAFPIVFTVCFICFPSTPKHLLRKGKIDKAMASLKFYRNSKDGQHDEIDVEFEKLKEVVEANKAISLKMSDFCKTSCSTAWIYNNHTINGEGL